MQAAISLASEGVPVQVFEKGEAGGQIRQTPLLENFATASGGVAGVEFVASMQRQAARMGAGFFRSRIVELETGPDGHRLTCDRGRTHTYPAVVLATGCRWRHLDIPGMSECVRAGRAHYGPGHCGMSLGRRVAVLGGGGAAGQGFLQAARSAGVVRLVSRSELHMPRYLEDRITDLVQSRDNAVLHLNNEIAELRPRPDGVEVDLACGESFVTDVLHVCAGLMPETEWLPSSIRLDPGGRVRVGLNGDLGTSVAGVFAIGDCRAGSYPRVASAIGDGANVAVEVIRYLSLTPGTALVA